MEPEPDGDREKITEFVIKSRVYLRALPILVHDITSPPHCCLREQPHCKPGEAPSRQRPGLPVPDVILPTAELEESRSGAMLYVA